jgi:hypothetical protein
MADIYQIPIQKDNASFKIRTDLEDDTYILDFYYNSRLGRWHVSISDADENPVLMGVPLNINYNILQRFRMTALPPGLMMLFDSTDAFNEADDETFADTALLLYQESSEES